MSGGTFSERVYRAVRSRGRALVRGVDVSPPIRMLQARRLRRLIGKRGATGDVLLHLGCGGNYFPGWINIDINRGSPGPDVILDLEKGIPAPEGVVDCIYAEDLLEHLEPAGTRRLLSDCSRILKKGGVLRLLTPNLRTLALAYVQKSETDLSWYRENVGCSTFAEMFNAGMRGWGHKFLWDEETLIPELMQLGFDVRQSSYNTSNIASLSGLDSRNSAQGAHTMYFECSK
jgi:predicted SAM-dependent methyltransferase